MALRQKVLIKKATKFELKETQKHNINPDRMLALGALLEDAYLTSRPKSNEYCCRRELIRVFNDMAKELYGNNENCPVVEEFGSFSMDLFSSGSDLDLSVNFHSNGVEFARDKKIRTLRKFAKKFYAVQSKGHVSGVHPILTAKVPILKVVDSGTGIECDLSVENRDGILKSKIVHLLTSIDERFHKLSCLMKAWAKANGINSSKDRTLNSLSIILFVAFHLQTRDPPIFPPLSSILKDGSDPSAVAKLVKDFYNYGRNNTESVAQLFFSLLTKLASVEKLWPKGLCVSPYKGSWISKTWDSKVGCMSVEDFTDQTQNVARAVGQSQVGDIYKCIHLSVQSIEAFLDGKFEGSALRESLFGYNKNLVGHPPTSIEPIQALPLKRTIQVMEGTQQRVNFNPKVTSNKVAQAVNPLKVTATLSDVPAQQVVSAKKMRFTKDRQGSSTGGWGGASGVGRSRLDWVGQPTASWAGPNAHGWGEKPSGSWDGAIMQGWGGKPPGSWGGPTTQGWGGKPAGSWGEPTIQGWGEGQTMGNWGGATTLGWGVNAGSCTGFFRNRSS